MKKILILILLTVCSLASAQSAREIKSPIACGEALVKKLLKQNDLKATRVKINDRRFNFGLIDTQPFTLGPDGKFHNLRYEDPRHEIKWINAKDWSTDWSAIEYGEFLFHVDAKLEEMKNGEKSQTAASGFISMTVSADRPEKDARPTSYNCNVLDANLMDEQSKEEILIVNRHLN